MRIEDKLVRGKSILSPDGAGEGSQYNVLHILGGTVLMMLIPLSIFFLSGRDVTVLYVSQYLAAAAVGLSIGYLAGCVPAGTLVVILLATTGRVLYKLLGGQMGSFGSREFNTRLLAWMAYASVLFGFSWLGAKLKDRRVNKGGGLSG